MGYSSRYHVASLAAVFLALGVGILIGTGLNGVVSDTSKNLAASIRGNLRSNLDDARAQASALKTELEHGRSFEQAAYRALVRGTLRGRRVAVIALGGLDGSLRSDIEQVVGPGNVTGAAVQDFAIVGEPPDLRSLAASIRGTALEVPALRGLARGGDALTALAARAGRALPVGGRIFRAVQDALLSHESGSPAGIDAVIVARQQPAGLDPSQADAVDRLENGLLAGLRRSGLPVVGVERSDAARSSISLFAGAGASSVDDVDQYPGRVALALALRGAQGSFGTKATADRLLPRLRGPRPAPGPSAGGAARTRP